jgi:MFS-type transporter involved in bile tolerance (Atg22 family)
METEVRSDTLNFAIAGFVTAAMDPYVRTFAEKPASRNTYLPIFTLIRAFLTEMLSID